MRATEIARSKLTANRRAKRVGRPSIGLALGGGAARGFAHIGVVRTLIAHGYKPEVITGTSMGAVVGGCCAAGHLDAFSGWACALSRRRVFGYLDVSFSAALASSTERGSRGTSKP